MIKIGDFSKLAHVTVKTLHHYDQTGLLQPAHVDRYTGYRYYNIDQFGRLNKILALKDLGFTLEQVGQLLDEELSLDEMRGMLRLKQMELARNLVEEHARLDNVERRLHQLAQDGQLPNQEIAVKTVPAQTVLCARVVAANESALLPARRSLQTLLSDHLKRTRLKQTTPLFALVDNGPYAEKELEVELAIGIELQSGQRYGDLGTSPVKLQELPEVKNMASVLHPGDNTELANAYTQLYTWAQSNGYQIAGSYREIYLSNHGALAELETNLDASLTELQCPVRRASIPISIQSRQGNKEQIMKPKIITKPAFKTVGLAYVGKNEQSEIPQMWGVFNQRSAEIPSIDQANCFGLCFSNPQDAAPGEFEYVAACEVADDKKIPEGMVLREVPEHKYAVFTHHGKLDKLGETYEFIYNTWLPQSGLEIHLSKFDMEVYDDRFIPDSDDSAFDIYVAIM